MRPPDGIAVIPKPIRTLRPDAGGTFRAIWRVHARVGGPFIEGMKKRGLVIGCGPFDLVG